VAILAFDFVRDWWDWSDKAVAQRIFRQAKGARTAIATGQTATKTATAIRKTDRHSGHGTDTTYVRAAKRYREDTRELRSTPRELR